MPSRHPFGNDPAKIDRYVKFWSRDTVNRPLVGFSFVGWYPLEYFTVCKSWQVDDYITPDMIRPDEWMDDYEGLLREGEAVDDDMLRGACPIQVAFPLWVPKTPPAVTILASRGQVSILQEDRSEEISSLPEGAQCRHSA